MDERHGACHGGEVFFLLTKPVVKWPTGCLKKHSPSDGQGAGFVLADTLFFSQV